MASTLFQAIREWEAANDPEIAAAEIIEHRHLRIGGHHRPHPHHIPEHMRRAGHHELRREHSLPHPPHHPHLHPHPHAAAPVTPATMSQRVAEARAAGATTADIGNAYGALGSQLAARQTAEAGGAMPGGSRISDAAYTTSDITPGIASDAPLPLGRPHREDLGALKRPGIGGKSMTLSDQDIHMIATVAEGEGGSDGIAGMRASAAAIINRMKSGQFGVNPLHRRAGDLQRLLEAPNQFESVDKAGGVAGLFDKLRGGPNRVAIGATLDIASGRVADPTGGSTYFQNRHITRIRHTEFNANVAPNAVIGKQAFYDGYGKEKIGVPDMQVAYNGRHYAGQFAGPAAGAQLADAVRPGRPQAMQVAFNTGPSM